MDAVGVVAHAISPLGEGDSSLSPIEEGALPTAAAARDPLLEAAALTRPIAARAAVSAGPEAATDLVVRLVDGCAKRLDGAMPGWRARRVGLVLGTSSGGMPAAEQAFEQLVAGAHPSRELLAMASYGAPFLAARDALGLPLAREAHLLCACASSTIALGVAQLWLASGACDVVFAGGYDVLTTFVASGFSALGAVTATRPSPFREGRDGLAPGEGGAVVAMVRAGEIAHDAALVCVGGFGASCDAVHVTAPDREGRGLAAACAEALAHAEVTARDIGYVSAHGTATSFNDAAEARAITATLGEAALCTPVHAMKGEIGHLFGAAGVIEALSAHRAMVAQIACATAGDGPIDPDARVLLLDRATRHEASTALKLAAAFGGLNAALVLRRAPANMAPLPPRRASVVSHTGRALPGRPLDQLAARLGVAVDRVARCDSMTRLVLDAVADLRDALGGPFSPRTGVVVGHHLANVETNWLYAQRLFTRGARLVEPRKFPYTSPNCCAGEVAILFGLKGPALAVGGAPGLASQARELATDLCRQAAGVRFVVVEVHEHSSVSELFDTASRSPVASPSFASACLVDSSA